MIIDDVNEKLYLCNPKSELAIESLIDSYPELREELDILESQRVKVIKFIILFYDLNSDVKNYVPEFWERKRICATLAGFKLKDGKKYSKHVKNFLIGSNIVVNGMIIRYLLLFNNPDYIELQVASDMYQKQALKAMKLGISAGADSVKKTNENLTILNKKIKETTILVFGGKESSELEEKLYFEMQRNRLELRPEDIANVDKDGNKLKDYDKYNLFQDKDGEE